MFRTIVFIAVMAFAYAAHASGNETPSLKEHGDVMEWVAKGLIIFFQFEIWRNQRSLFKRTEDVSERVAKVEGFCDGKQKVGGC